MAGAGVRLFSAGSQVLASQINTYLMDQTVAYFADSAARDASFGGAGQPTLSPGRVCYLFSDNKLYLYGNDNAWAEIGAQLDDSEVTTAKINDLAVTTAKLADNSVTSAKIVDGSIVNADINASAGIALSKLASGTAAQVVVHNSSGVPTATTVTGDVTISSSGVTARSYELPRTRLCSYTVNAGTTIASFSMTGILSEFVLSVTIRTTPSTTK